MTLEFYLLYCGTLFLASIVPGPSMILALNHGIRYGAKRTVVTALGNVTASLIQASVSIVGLGAVLAASQKVFLTIKWIGALYLIYIGIQSFRISILPDNSDGSEHVATDKKSHSLFAEAFFVAMGNPKAILFFSALFPQFINITEINTLPLIGAMLTLAVIAFLCFMIYAVGGERMISLFKQRSVGKLFSRVIGTAFVGSGLGILLKR